MLQSYKEQMEGVRDMTTVKEDGITYQKWIQLEDSVVYKMRHEQNKYGQKQVSVFDGKYY